MITIIFMFLIFGVGLHIGNLWNKHVWGEYPELERMAKLMLANGTLQEIKKFTNTTVGCLKEKTFTQLCNRLEELKNDLIINEDENNLKVRISTIEDKAIELKKLQAESFIETLKTLKTMCVGGKSR